jgi:hypothetical protein
MKEIKKIMSTIQSFRDSSCKTIALKNESFHISGMNSPYTSHQTIEVNAGHGRENLITIYTHEIMFSSNRPDEENDGQCWKQIPAYWVRQMLNETGLFPFGLPEWLNRQTVWAIIPDRFRGYDEAGKPIWDKRNTKISPWYSSKEFSLRFVFVDLKEESE